MIEDKNQITEFWVNCGKFAELEIVKKKKDRKYYSRQYDEKNDDDYHF